MNGIGKGAIAAAFIICIVLFIGMCIFIASFAIVDPNFMAISRNKITNRIDEDKVYFEGRHYIGVGNAFIYYPMAWQLIEFTDDDASGIVDFVCKTEEPLDASTSDAAAIEVELSLYFTIPPQELINFYTIYGINYQDSLSNECKRVLKEVCTQFQYKELFQFRQNISSSMTNSLARALERRRLHLESLLLRGIFFGDALETSIETTVCEGQKEYQERYNTEKNKVTSEIETMVSEYDLDIRRIVAQAEVDAKVIMEEARGNATALLARTTAESWKDYQEKTGLNAKDLLRVQWARTLGATTSKDSIAVGYDTVGAKFVQKVQ